MTKSEWKNLMDALTDAWNKITGQFEELAEALTDAFTMRKTLTRLPYDCRKRQRPPKKIGCTYSIERRIQRNLPYQRRIF